VKRGLEEERQKEGQRAVSFDQQRSLK